MRATRPRQDGRLYVFEGPDGIGKSTLATSLSQELTARGVRSEYLAFPGKEAGTLGHLVYELHHVPGSRGVDSTIDPTSLQMLHIAAHIDAINSRIHPLLADGCVVVLDRFWWSTWAYGRANGVDRTSLQLMLNLEHAEWRGTTPEIAFLVDRDEPLRTEYPLEYWKTVREAYAELAMDQSNRHRVVKIDNRGKLEEALAAVLEAVEQDTQGEVQGQNRQRHRLHAQTTADSEGGTRITKPPRIFSGIAPAVPTKVYDTLWYFAAERQQVFFNRLKHMPPPWTTDRIMQKYKFTNSFRASDRVSQFLISHVIFAGDQAPEEVFFRTTLFKFFNRISTWELLTHELGEITFEGYDYVRYDRILNNAMEADARIFSNAYIMPSGTGELRASRKHRTYLRLLERMMASDAGIRIQQMESLREVFEYLRTFPLIGDFLAYQLAIDLNYGPLTNFSEMEFVVPGPGARDGLSKCFSSYGGLNAAELIRVVTERQQHEFERLGINFRSLWGRPLQLIDVQNLFCEVSKYARLAHPDVPGAAGRTRIKQLFRSAGRLPVPWYPPKWGLNALVRKEIGEADGCS